MHRNGTKRNETTTGQRSWHRRPARSQLLWRRWWAWQPRHQMRRKSCQTTTTNWKSRQGGEVEAAAAAAASVSWWLQKKIRSCKEKWIAAKQVRRRLLIGLLVVFSLLSFSFSSSFSQLKTVRKRSAANLLQRQLQDDAAVCICMMMMIMFAGKHCSTKRKSSSV